MTSELQGVFSCLLGYFRKLIVIFSLEGGLRRLGSPNIPLNAVTSKAIMRQSLTDLLGSHLAAEEEQETVSRQQQIDRHFLKFTEEWEVMGVTLPSFRHRLQIGVC